MIARTIAGWTAVTAGLLLVIGIALASLVPAVAAVGAGGGPPGTCTDGPGMMGAAGGHMGGTGMMGATGHMGSTGMTGGSHMGGTGMMGATSATCHDAGTSDPAIAGATEVSVRATNFAFTPSEVRLPKGAAVNLTLENPSSTGVVHDFTVSALGIHVAANAGETRSVGLRNLAAGRYDAYCSVPGHANLGMRATVIVE